MISIGHYNQESDTDIKFLRGGYFSELVLDQNFICKDTWMVIMTFGSLVFLLGIPLKEGAVENVNNPQRTTNLNFVCPINYIECFAILSISSNNEFETMRLTIGFNFSKLTLI